MHVRVLLVSQASSEVALSSLELRTLPYRCFETLTKVRADIPHTYLHCQFELTGPYRPARAGALGVGTDNDSNCVSGPGAPVPLLLAGLPDMP